MTGAAALGPTGLAEAIERLVLATPHQMSGLVERQLRGRILVRPELGTELDLRRHGARAGGAVAGLGLIGADELSLDSPPPQAATPGRAHVLGHQTLEKV